MKKRFCIEIEMDESDYDNIGFSGGMKCTIKCSNGDEWTGDITTALFAPMQSKDDEIEELREELARFKT